MQGPRLFFCLCDCWEPRFDIDAIRSFHPDMFVPQLLPWQCAGVCGAIDSKLAGRRIEPQATHPQRKRGGIFIVGQSMFEMPGVSIKLASGSRMSTGGEVANALVCKISIRGFNSRPVLQ